MPERIGLAAMLEMGNFNKGLKQYTSGIERMDKDMTTKGRSMTKMLSGIGKTVGKVMVAGIAAGGAAIAALGVGMAKLAIDAAPLQGIKAAFEGITAASGIAADEMLAALKESAAGMITGKEAMEAYNLAAMLVGEQFAKELPNAMQYLTKVSAATGESMDFMMTSLVRGVGRLSPMILDNLGIQVNLTQAYEDYATQMGINVEEMTKTEQQTALMNQVMVLLQRNTAAMPEVTGTAAAAMGALRAQLQDTKDEIGLALLPAFTTIMGVIGEFASENLPRLVAVFEEHVVPALEVTVAWLIEKLPEAIAAAGEAIQWISEHLDTIKPVLIGVGATAALAFGVWAVNAAIAAAATIAATWPILAIAAAVTALYAAWVSDWGGIRTFLEDTWEQYLKPIFDAAVEWLQVAIPAAIESSRKWWENVLKPALEVVSDFLTEHVFPMFEALAEWLSEKIPEAIEEVRQWWEETFGGSLKTVRDFVETKVFPMFRALVDWLWIHIPQAVAFAAVAFDALTTLIRTGTLPAVGDLIADIYFLAEEFRATFTPTEELTKGVSRFTDYVWGASEASGNLGGSLSSLRGHIGNVAGTMEDFLPVLNAVTEGLSVLAPETTKKAEKALKDLSKTLRSPVIKAAREAKGMLREISAALQELTINWIPKLAEVFGVRMRQMFKSARNIRGELQELFSMGGVFGGLAQAAVTMLQTRTLGPLEEELEAVVARLAEIAEMTGMERLVTYWEEEPLLLRRQEITEEIAKHEANILALRERQMELGFLQQQVELLKLIEDYDLEIEDIMGGMVLGIEADAGDVLDAMVRAMQEVITVVEEELGILSPSRIFMEMGTETMKGLALGMAKTAAIPLAITSEVMHRVSAPALFQQSMMTMPTSTSSTVNVSMGGVSIYDQMSAAMFEARVRQIMASSVGG